MGGWSRCPYLLVLVYVPYNAMKMSLNLDELFNGQPVRVFRKKTLISRSGQDIDGLFRIESGQIKVTACTEDGQEFTLNNLGPGDPFPLPLYFDVVKPTLRYTAETTLKATWQERAVIDKYLYAHPEVLYMIIRKILEVLYNRINTLSGGSADDRVLKRLIELSDRWATPGEDKFEITTTQQDIADSVCLSRESVNMVLKRLADKGVLTMGRNKIYMSIAKAKAELGSRSSERLC